METAKFILFLMVTVSSLYATKGQWQWPCEETVDCGGLSEVECVSGECRCPVGFQIDAAGTGCIAAAPYVNSECTVDYQCRHLMTGYSCYNGVCSCLSGHVYMHGRCWETVGFGEPCVSSRQCHDSLMPLSLQCKSNTCACADGYYSRERGLCRKIVSELNGACILDQDCQISSAPDAVCSLKTLTCVESEGDNDGVIFDTKIDKIQSFFDTKLASLRPSKMAGVEDKMAVGDNKMAAPKAGVKEGDTCLTDEECAGLGEASCLYRQCICRQGFFPNGNQTICGAELGIQVTEEKYCAGFGAKLLNGICDCPAGYFYQENVRDCKKPSRRLGDSCLDDRSCFTFGRAGKCSESEETSLRTCGCDSTLSLMNEDKQICELFDKSIGDGCENTEECPTNVQCIDKVCNCIGDETPNTAGTACLLGGLEIGDQCTLDTQCKDKNSKCKNGLCTCNDDYYVNEGVCEVGLGGSCTSGEECTVANSVCDEDSKKCSCGDGYVSEDNGQCFKLATSWTDSCQLDDQCRPALGDNSTVYCWEGTCKCTADSHLRDHKCWPKIELRGVCARSSECYLKEDISRTECRNSLCQCQIGFTELYNPDICSAGETSRILAFLPILSLLMTLLLFK